MDADHITIRPLSTDTWSAFADLVARHNGVFGGCWCTWFHTLSREKDRTYESNRDLKCRLVEQGDAHAALVFDGDEAVAWCEYGTPEELPNIYHRKQYDEELDLVPDYRITCIFVDRRYRRRGVAALALRGALDLIADAGGGVVEGYPHDNDGAKVSVLYDGTRHLFERAGFDYVRPKGSRNCVMRTKVRGTAPSTTLKAASARGGQAARRPARRGRTASAP
jgi:ribosomal protein S18 acetylase RimI-like enzyme